MTQRPPAAVRAILHMCGYLGIDYQSEYFWLALVACCMPLPAGWTYNPDAQTYTCAS